MEKILFPTTKLIELGEFYEICQENEYFSLYYNEHFHKCLCRNIKEIKVFDDYNPYNFCFAIKNNDGKWALVKDGVLVINFILKDIIYPYHFFSIYHEYVPYLSQYKVSKDGILLLVTDNLNVGLFSMQYGVILMPQDTPLYLHDYGFSVGDNFYNYDGHFQFNKKEGKYIYTNGNKFYRIFRNNNEEVFLISVKCGKDCINVDGGGIFKMKKIVKGNSILYCVEDFVFDGHFLERGKTLIENPNYEDDFCTCDDEDTWNAMTDGQYGDYPGTGWEIH